jgi:hypothetical protein
MTTFVRSTNLWQIDAITNALVKTISVGEDLDAVAIGPSSPPALSGSLAAESDVGASRRSPTAIGCRAFAV